MARTSNSDAERLTKQVVFVLQPSLFDAFERRCRDRYKSVSEVLRELMAAYGQREE
ncbi:hypothetical protein [Planctomyces sp. SH-PL62]|uniref:hypothetical protein n=1 Tax=Planctomyces sp. SH-PL62 TaxID=1636152 RepID=UPI0012E8FE9C|nr:hypothetical protein [Planctomyces sp. SH-PL62]